MKAMFIDYFFKNKINVFGFMIVPFMMAFSNTDPGFLFFMTFILADTYTLNHEEFSLSLPVSFNDRVMAHLLYILFSITAILIPFVGISFFKPYPIQKMIIGISAIITSTFFRARKFYQANTFIHVMSGLMQFIIFFLTIEKNIYPLVAAIYSIALTFFVYFINYNFARKNTKEQYYVKS
ncbi:MAG TPA: hypothetical protein VFC75_01050 [Erysipelothrix sp.]|nr:hypothetical protein [Erysipelothrix sp.]